MYFKAICLHFFRQRKANLFIQHNSDTEAIQCALYKTNEAENVKKRKHNLIINNKTNILSFSFGLPKLLITKK